MIFSNVLLFFAIFLTVALSELNPVINPSDYPATMVLKPDLLTVWWKVDENAKTIEVALQCNCTGWVGFGLSSGEMKLSDVTISTYVSGQLVIEDYWIDGNYKVASDVSRGGVNNVLEFNGTQINGVSSYKFIRPLFTNDTDFDYMFNSGTLTGIFAGKKTDQTISHHEFQGIISADFYTGSAFVPVDEKRNSVYIHAVLMLLAWACFIPMGSLLARFGKYFYWWFNLHRIVQMTGLTLAVAGFILAVSFSTFHFDGPHKIIGLVIIILALAQPVIGTVADKWWDPTRNSAPIFPDGLHWVLGWGTLLLAFVNIALGIRMYNESYTLENQNFVVFVAGAGTFVVVTIILAILQKVKGSKTKHTFEQFDSEPLLH